MLTAEYMEELLDDLREGAEKLSEHARRLGLAMGREEVLAFKVLDFERGLLSLPELTASAREVVGTKI